MRRTLLTLQDFEPARATFGMVIAKPCAMCWLCSCVTLACDHV
jgi:hypothetical protein